MKHNVISIQTRRALDALHESVREPLPRAQIARFAALLHRTIGLDAASIGNNAIERAVADRYAAWRAANAVAFPAAGIDDFWVAVNGVPQQLQALIEAVVVPETWFFRDSEAFNALVVLARARLAEQPFRPVRILCMPCSTGEEAYTIAMAMLDAGIAPERFTIDAIDISNHALDTARQARYGSNAFRSRALGFRDRHFKPSGDHWRLSADVTERVRFRQANLLTLETQAFEPFDFVFCRNVLIYFDRPMQRTAVRVLDDLLAPGATLFVGPAETGLMMREGMTSAKLALAFAFRRLENDRPSLDDASLKDVKTRALYSAIAEAEEALGFPMRNAAPRVASASANLAAANAFASRAGALWNESRLSENANAGRFVPAPAAKIESKTPSGHAAARPAPEHQGTGDGRPIAGDGRPGTGDDGQGRSGHGARVPGRRRTEIPHHRPGGDRRRGGGRLGVRFGCREFLRFLHRQFEWLRGLGRQRFRCDGRLGRRRFGEQFGQQLHVIQQLVHRAVPDRLDDQLGSQRHGRRQLDQPDQARHPGPADRRIVGDADLRHGRLGGPDLQ